MIAEVIVDVLNSNVDRIFDYGIPEPLVGTVEVGRRVWVPFAGRGVSGMVASVKEQSDVATGKLKQVLSVLDAQPVVSPELMALMWHLSKKNHMLLADILRLFIPAEMRGGRVRDKVQQFVCLADNSVLDRLVFKGNAKAQTALVDYLRECGGGPVKKAELCELFSASSVNALVRKGALLLSERQIVRTPYENLVCGPDSRPELTPEQRASVSAVVSAFGSGEKFLLHGVTGSGKTEVYLHCISECIARGKTAVLLVPEIALTPQMLKVFRSRFHEQVAILHSGLSAGERYDEWWRLKSGEARIAIGARSAVFAPVDNLGVLIIDEEHDQSYVPDGGKYETRDVAEFRCAYHNCVLVLGSATPAVETYHRAERGELRLLELGERINRRPMPNVRIVDMREELRAGNHTAFSGELKSQLDRCLAEHNQAMLFINRRGYASIVMCKECGYVAKCDDCDVTLTYHREEEVLKCHYCSKRFKMLDVCPQCGSGYIRRGGMGTERVVHDLQKMYPNIRILRMDNDTTQTKESHFRIVKEFSERKADILVGTQMIAKGHDFKDVSLVGILDADLSLYFSDYRSAERTFQLITQVAGRAGRADVEGTVVLQTYSPQHEVFRLATKHDYRGFYEREIALREATHYPPFAKIVRLSVSGESEEEVVEVLKENFLAIQALKERYPECFLYLNRMKSPIKRIQKRYRYQILMRLTGEDAERVLELVYGAMEGNQRRNVVSYIEVNPINMY